MRYWYCCLTVVVLGFILCLMKIINRYFGNQLLGIFVMLLLILVGVAWMMQIMTMMKFLLTYGVDFSSFVYLTSLMIPFIISIIVPFVTFITIIFIYNKMISENEITVKDTSATDEVKVEVKTTRTKKTSKRKATKKSKEVESE